MAHGPSDKCDPNLIPLLDLVLQLVMFFMVCANFVMEQLNESIKLPEAIAAQPLGRKDDYVIFLNVNKDGQVILSPLDAIGKDSVLTNPLAVQSYMKQRYEEDIRAAGGDRSKPARSTLIIRADKEAPFEKTYAILKACRTAGYERAQLRAVIYGGQTNPQ
jgi:biopolymer transport protein ExbD